MQEIRVVVVDDSSLFRRALTLALESIPGVKVVAALSDGAAALKKIPELKPDLVTLDLEMPGMGGMETLRALRGGRSVGRILIVSAHSKRGAGMTIEALCHGADDFITKAPAEGFSGMEGLKGQLRDKLASLFAERPRPGHTPLPVRAAGSKVEAVVIAVSTGGPNALSELFGGLVQPLPVPILVVQHMPPNFTKLLAERLSSKGVTPVSEAVHGEPIRPGRAYVAPGDFHMEVQGGVGGVNPVLRLHQEARLHSCRPAADLLFRSAAGVYRSGCLGVVMTGMGADGAAGAQSIVEGGGQVLLQDEASSVVYGMPGAVIEKGVRHRVVPLHQLAATISDYVRLPLLPGTARSVS